MEHREITEQIIGCAYKVYNTLGAGFLESVYHKALLIECQRVGLRFNSECPIDVLYEGESVGQFFADIIVEEKVVVELKAIRAIVTAHEIQLVNYLAATGMPVGLVINFGEERIEIKRKVRRLS